MILMDERYSEELLRANINVLHINLDGNTDLTYGYVKGRQTVDVVKNNIQTFFRVREKLKASCQIIIGMVPAKAYAEFFEHSPIAFPDYRSISKTSAIHFCSLVISLKMKQMSFLVNTKFN